MTPLSALQAAIAGEHAAVYVFGVLGAQTSESANPALFARVKAAHDLHRTQRDRLGQLIGRAGAEPAAADASYVLPNQVSSVAEVRAAARVTEERCLELYGQLVENAVGANRAWAINAMSVGAIRVVGFGASPEPFPGLTTAPSAGASVRGFRVLAERGRG